MKKQVKNLIKFLIKTIKKPEKILIYIKLYITSNKKRYKESMTNIFRKKIFYTDSASFTSMYYEIFDKEIYRFNTNSTTPFIIDCGSNIGLSLIYFKKQYPNSKIIAFEPDREIFKILNKNIESLKLDGVEIINKGLWNKKEKK